MNNLTAGNPVAHSIRLYYEGDSTIYEGMPLCYNYDTTTNWFGGTVTDGAVTATNTTAEGAQNEGKYIRVEDVGNDGIMSLAGVVKRGGWCGKTGPRVVDVYVPNGAIVPVRSGIATTRMCTVFGIQSGSDAFETAIYGTRSANCAIAMETVDRATDEGLCLAQLFSPLAFNKGSQDHDYEAFKVGVGLEAGDLNFMKEYVQINSTGGTFKTRWWETDIVTDGVGCPYGGVISSTLRLFAASKAQGSDVVNTYINTQLDTAATIAAGVELKNLYLRLNGAAGVLTDADSVSNIYMENGFPVGTLRNYQIYSTTGGADNLDAFLACAAINNISAIAMTGDHAFDTSDYCMRVSIANVIYYIPLMNNRGD